MFYTYYKLQGSQTQPEWLGYLNWFYTYYKLQGSQTDSGYYIHIRQFYTYYKLQGSQTQMAQLQTLITVLHLL